MGGGPLQTPPNLQLATSATKATKPASDDGKFV